MSINPLNSGRWFESSPNAAHCLITKCVPATTQKVGGLMNGDVGNRIHRECWKTGISTAELAEAAQRSESQIRRYMSGARIPECVLKRITTALGTTPEALRASASAEAALRAHKAYGAHVNQPPITNQHLRISAKSLLDEMAKVPALRHDPSPFCDAARAVAILVTGILIGVGLMI